MVASKADPQRVSAAQSPGRRRDYERWNTCWLSLPNKIKSFPSPFFRPPLPPKPQTPQPLFFLCFKFQPPSPPLILAPAHFSISSLSLPPSWLLEPLPRVLPAFDSTRSDKSSSTTPEEPAPTLAAARHQGAGTWWQKPLMHLPRDSITGAGRLSRLEPAAPDRRCLRRLSFIPRPARRALTRLMAPAGRFEKAEDRADPPGSTRWPWFSDGLAGCSPLRCSRRPDSGRPLPPKQDLAPRQNPAENKRYI